MAAARLNAAIFLAAGLSTLLGTTVAIASTNDSWGPDYADHTCYATSPEQAEAQARFEHPNARIRSRAAQFYGQNIFVVLATEPNGATFQYTALHTVQACTSMNQLLRNNISIAGFEPASTRAPMDLANAERLARAPKLDPDPPEAMAVLWTYDPVARKCSSFLGLMPYRLSMSLAGSSQIHIKMAQLGKVQVVNAISKTANNQFHATIFFPQGRSTCEKMASSSERMRKAEIEKAARAPAAMGF